MKISIITVCYNSEKTIRKTIESVLNQNHIDIEYIIIDGGSIDNTLNIVYQYQKYINKIISEPDNGLYDAINKGILLATGEIVGLLNSDDVFINNDVVSDIVENFELNDNVDSIIGDVSFINNKGKKHRKYSARGWNPLKFSWGIMPPHPTFYCKRKYFFQFGLYRTDFKIAADYELMIRFLLVNKITYKYIPKVLVIMNLGGVSTKNLFSKIKINQEVLFACRLNKVKTNYFKIYTKYLFKIIEYF